LIEKIQAGVRGRIARKTYGNEKAKYALKDLVENVKSRVDDYTNQDVLEIIGKLGPFEYDDSVLLNDGVTRENRSLTLLDNKTRYEGQWNTKTNERDGMGVLIWPDGSIYEGFWKHNKANGKGRLIHADRDVYVGDWQDDKAHGEGTYLHSDGAKYEGEWVLDKQQGKGRESWPDGAVFEGNYLEGKKHGHGYFKWADGSDYRG